MVKNQGGKRTKGAARKMLTSRPSNKLRLSECEEEKYAFVTKVCGGRICQVKTLCSIELLCHIRGKFSGRNKSANLITIGSLLLIGIRDFGKNECDVIEVYNANEVELLKQMPDIDLSNMHKYTNPFHSSEISINTEDDLLIDFRRTKEPTEEIINTNEIIMEENETINIDDI
jgi:initiation factor 1A